ncbi:MAG TPA: hypothetical protein VFI60_00340, partial [Candidatus Acidoferrum sp.]|nr:hypothetical protein [Candidatus Acidoferrum sp.]
EVASSNLAVPTIFSSSFLHSEVIQMEATDALENKRSSDNRPRIALWFLAPVVTVDVLLSILLRWHSFGVIEKFNAIVLSFFLLVVPGAAVWGERTGRKSMGRLEIAIVAYICLMMATMVFSGR